MKQLIVGFIFTVLLSHLAFADQLHDKQTKLNTLKQSISSLKKNISLTRSQKSKIENQLQASEQNIGQTAKKLHGTMKALRHEQHLLNKSLAKHRYYESQLKAQKQLLQNHIRAAYMLGRQQYLKLVLSQKNPENINRYLTYYHYIIRARLHAMQHIQGILKHIETSTAVIRKQTRKLEKTRMVQQHQNNQLVSERDKRHSILAKLNQSISTKQQKLTELTSDKLQLEGVVQHLQSQRYYYSIPGANLAKARGKLPWPIQHGQITQSFNQDIVGGRLHTTGILMQAKMGEPIHAIFPGKVVFAHWLRGFGLLVIVLHSHSFMTLYAHAESLYVKTGEQVEPGQVIATVGNSGGFKQSALYFEMRHHGIPLNPVRWLRAKA